MADIVFGGGMGAARAAAVRRGATLVEPSAFFGGRELPQIPENGGRTSAANRQMVSDCYGSAPFCPPPKARDVAVFKDKDVVGLPLNPWTIRGLVSREDYGRLLSGQLRARGEVLFRMLKGGGVEERTYRDWVLHRYGKETYALLHRPYAEKRFGDPGQLHISAARVHHASTTREEVFLGSEPERGISLLKSQIDRVSLDTSVEGLGLVDGRVRTLQTNQGGLEVDAGLYYSGRPIDLLSLLGDAVTPSLRADCGKLVARHRIQVAFELVDAPDSEAKAIHWLSESHPFYLVQDISRSTDTSRRFWCGQISVSESSQLWHAPQGVFEEMAETCVKALGFPDVVRGTVGVDRLAHYDPGWVGVWHPVHARIRASLSKIGIELVGRTGLHRFLDAGEELALVDSQRNSGGVLDEDLLRLLGDPPVVLEDENQRLDAFVTR